jgi:P27 family predicted phage terminase small subunit
MKRGRKPTPNHLRLIQGNPRGKPINRYEPRASGALKDPPAWLTPAQQEGWRYAVENAPAGLLKLLDRSALTVWVLAEEMHRSASEKIQQHGMLIKTPNGMPMPSPFVTIQHRQACIMLRAAAELGFTPSSRSQIVVEQDHGNAFANNGRRDEAV